MSSWRCFLPAVLIVLSSCSGYRFVNQRNPLAQYGISKVAIPMFVNRTIYPHITGPFTREITAVLNQYPDLRVYPGEYSKADAILVGVLTSPDHRAQAYKTDSRIFISGDLERSIGQRRPYFLPLSTSFRLSMRIVVIKDPSWEDIEFIQKALDQSVLDQGGVLTHPKVVIDQELNLNSSFGRQILSNQTPDEGGVVNATKNEDAEERTIRGLAQSAGRQFSELVLNVF